MCLISRDEYIISDVVVDFKRQRRDWETSQLFFYLINNFEFKQIISCFLKMKQLYRWKHKFLILLIINIYFVISENQY